MRLAVALLIASTVSAAAGERVGYIHYPDRPDLITQVRETSENGKAVYVVVERPSGFIYRQDYAPDGTVWQKP